MNEALQNLEIKVENGGSTPQGRVSAAEWNVLVAGVKALDLAGFDEAALRDYLDRYDYITRPELDKALEGIGGGSGSGIAYPLSWSGYSSGVYDGSASANIAIPSLMSQLDNDVEFITSDSVNSLLTGYLPKSGGTLSGDISTNSFSTGTDNLGVFLEGKSKNGIRLQYYKNEVSFDMLLLSDGEMLWNNQHVIHSGNVAGYALPITGGTVSGNITAPKFIGDLMGQWLPRLPSRNANEIGTTFGWMNTAQGDWNIPDDGAGCIVSFDGGKGLNAIQFFSPYTTNTLKYRSRTHIDNSWKEWREVAFTDSNVASATKLASTRKIWGQSFDGTSDINGDICFIAGGDWKIGTPYEVGQKVLYNYITFGAAVTGIEYVSGKWTSHPNIVAHRFITGQSDNAISVINNGNVAIGGTTADERLHVHGNILVTGEITQHSSLVLKDVVDTRFLTLKELVALKPYSFRWKDGRDDKLHAGAVADYVMPILPEVISTDKDNIHSMNYANAAWIVGTSLTPYVSELVDEMKRLKERIKYLEDKLKGC